ncbi:MAG TPA: protein kinase [Verrucomicrobiae bacterium]|nr:protein kinase [Verrucomicrobiae bacterium]
MSTIVGYLIGQVGEFSGARFAIPEAGLVVGRDPKHADLVIEHPLVSRRHAQIARAANNALVLTDLESRNGTFLNGHRLDKPVSLQSGDKIDFGGQAAAVFQFDSAQGAPLTGMLAQIFGEVAAPVEWQPGDTILDLYEVKKVLGQGGMGRVYLVHHRSWNMDLVVKSPLPKIFENDEGKANFIREAETWVNLNLHPNICQCHYVRTIGGIPRIFAEYVPGGTLQHWIAQKKLTQLDQILDLAIQFAWGLHAAHKQGIVHQDVKPGNVLMTADGILKISDFGLARARALAGESTEVRQNLLVSAGGLTPAYCSPEQASGKRLTPKSDIWSWALSILQIFTGGVVWRFGIEAPEVLARYERFFGPNFVVPIPKRLRKLLSHCFHVRPEDRPKDMLDIANELQAIYQQARGEPNPRPEPEAAEHLADSLNNRAVSLMDLGKQDEALRLWGQALKGEPHHPEATYNDALVRWRLACIGDDELVQRLKEVCGSHQDNWLPNYLLALCHIERDDCNAALRILEEITEVPSNYEFLTAATETAQVRLPTSTRLVRELIGHQDEITCLCVAEDKHLVASGSSDKTLKLWDMATGVCLRTLVGHSNGVTCAALSRDSQFVVSGGSDQSVKLWAVRTGKCLQTFETDRLIPLSLSVTDDGGFVVCGSADELRMWDVSTGRCVQSLTGLTSGTGFVSISPDGIYALSAGGSDNLIGLWKVHTGRRLQVFKGHTDEIVAACLSYDGRSVLSGAHEEGCKLWEAATGRCLKTFGEQAARDDGLLYLAWNGRRAVAGYVDSIRLWDVATGKCLRTFDADLMTSPTALCLACNDRFAISGTFGHVIQQWQLRYDANLYSAPLGLCRATNTESFLAARSQYREDLQNARLEMGHSNSIAALRYVLRARSQPGHARAREALELVGELYLRLPHKAFKAGWEDRALKGHTHLVLSVSVSASGEQVISGGNDATIRLWQVKSGKCVSTLIGHENSVDSVFLGMDDRYALSGSADRTLRLWDLSTGKCLRTFEGHTDAVYSVCLSADGKYALSGGRDATVRFWEVASGRCLRKVDTQGNSMLSAVSFAPDCRYALSNGGRDNKDLKLWEITSGRCVRAFAGHNSLVQTVCVTRDGRYFFSGSSDNTLRHWELASGGCLRVFKGHTDSVRAVSVTADGRYVVSASYDGTIRVWEVATGRCVRILEGHTSSVWALDLSLNGQCLVSGGADHTVRMWRLDWELEACEPANWDEGAKPYLEGFLTRRTPYAAELSANRQLTEEEITAAFTRRGKPAWSESDFKGLLYELGCAGYGWLRPEGVRRELEKMAATWNEPPPLSPIN